MSPNTHPNCASYRPGKTVENQIRAKIHLSKYDTSK